MVRDLYGRVIPYFLQQQVRNKRLYVTTRPRRKEHARPWQQTSRRVQSSLKRATYIFETQNPDEPFWNG